MFHGPVVPTTEAGARLTSLTHGWDWYKGEKQKPHSVMLNTPGARWRDRVNGLELTDGLYMVTYCDGVFAYGQEVDLAEDTPVQSGVIVHMKWEIFWDGDDT